MRRGRPEGLFNFLSLAAQDKVETRVEDDRRLFLDQNILHRQRTRAFMGIRSSRRRREGRRSQMGTASRGSDGRRSHSGQGLCAVGYAGGDAAGGRTPHHRIQISDDVPSVRWFLVMIAMRRQGWSSRHTFRGVR